MPARGWFASRKTEDSVTSETATWSILSRDPPIWRTCPTSGSNSCGMHLLSTSITISWRRGPYASSGGIFTLFLSPGLIPTTAASNPGITIPSPMVNSRGSFPAVESKTVPSSSLPT
ncbi:MAG: hypothetical protein A4E51_00736 [Methanosaeta sp. PtaU1.Bin055]|nr:MAG: hypothetical protein A4E51_00736 [Methanosaeta sp. PtaU1.Bin055]